MARTIDKWMIYGAYGYTGELCAREARRRGLAPVLAGRNAERLTALGRELELETRAFALDAPESVADRLGDVSLVLHCAGPFSATAEPMVQGCARRGAHYLDVTGEIDVFEYIHRYDAEWREAGILALPGIGMDVVPTDCLAAKLKAALPESSELELAFRWFRRLSAGTMKTSVEGAASGVRRRVDGRIVPAPPGVRRRVPFADGEAKCIAIPWGDVSTAYYSTGIPNITVYSTLPEVPRFVQRAMGSDLVQRAAKTLVGWAVTGPDEGQRARARTEVWGRVASADGRSVSMTLTAPESYTLTVMTALAAVEKLKQTPPEPGAKTPSMALGADFIDGIDGVTLGALRSGADGP